MKTESKKFLNILLVAIISVTGTFSFTYADSAFIPGGYWDQLLQNGGLFGGLTRNGGLFSGNNSGTNERLIQTNCQYEERPNAFTGQTTYDLICDNRNVTYNSQPTYTYSQPSYYQQPTYYYTQTYTEPTYYYNYSQPTYYGNGYNNVDTLSYYTGSNIWYPQNNYGYSDSRMFGTYYNGGRGDVTGFYDSPYLCFDGGPNCGGYPREDDYYREAQLYGQSYGLSPDQVDYYYNQGYNSYDSYDPYYSNYYAGY